MQTPKSKIVNLAIALFAMLLPWPHLVEAQQPAKLPRIGYVARGTRPPPLLRIGRPMHSSRGC